MSLASSSQAPPGNEGILPLDRVARVSYSCLQKRNRSVPPTDPNVFAVNVNLLSPALLLRLTLIGSRP